MALEPFPMQAVLVQEAIVKSIDRGDPGDHEKS